MGHSIQAHKISNKGQTVVEYILLMAVIATVTLGVLNNSTMMSFVKEDGEFFEQLRDYMSYNYRHAGPRSAGMSGAGGSYTGRHHSYFNTGRNNGRFFYSEDAYGE